MKYPEARIIPERTWLKKAVVFTMAALVLIALAHGLLLPHHATASDHEAPCSVCTLLSAIALPLLILVSSFGQAGRSPLPFYYQTKRLIDLHGPSRLRAPPA